MTQRVKDDRRYDQRGSRGFALIATLSIMSLVMMVLLGTISLTKSTTKSSQSAKYLAEARANARMALNLAIAELQKELGPDQRISANMAVFSGSPNQVNFDPNDHSGYKNPHYLGTWDSWQTWLSDGIASTYERGRTSKFRKVLVSHPQSDVLSADDWRTLSLDGYKGDSVSLVASSGLPSKQVSVPLVETQGGGYAWYVSGNNQKANLRLPQQSTNTSIADSSSNLSNLRSNGVGSMLDSRLSGYPKEKISLDKVVSQDSAALASSIPQGADEYFEQNFHAFTPYSKSVLSDVRFGGLKKDLNLLLELDQLPHENSEWAKYGLSENLLPANLLNSLPREDNNGNTSIQQLMPSWRKLSYFYNEYKNSDLDVAEVNYSHIGTGTGTPKDNGQFINDSQMRRVPVMTTFTVMTALVNTNNTVEGLRVQYNPIVTFWNPYNHPIQLSHDRFLSNKVEHGLKVSVYDGDETNPSAALKYHVNGNWPVVWLANLGVRFKLPATDENSNPITFAPGESKFFSMHDLIERGSDWTLREGLRDNWGDYGGQEGALLQDYLAVTDGNSVKLADEPVENLRFSLRRNPGRLEMYMYQPVWFEVKYNKKENHPEYQNWENEINQYQAAVFPNVRYNLIFQQGYSFKGGKITNGSADVTPLIVKNFLHTHALSSRSQQDVANGGVVPKDFIEIHPYSYFFTLSRSMSSVAYPRALTDEPQVFEPVSDSRVAFYEISTSPSYSIASFGRFPLDMSYYDFPSSGGGNTGRVGLENTSVHQTIGNYGIGDSFASPLIGALGIHAKVDLLPTMDASGNEVGGEAAFDRAFLCNDALFDGWFHSSITQQSDDDRFSISRSATNLFQQFAEGGGALPNQHLVYDEGNEELGEITSKLFGSGIAEDAFSKVAQYMMLNGGFNVNSTSVEAWKALFAGLAGGEFHYRDSQSGEIKGPVKVNDGEILLSRFSLPCSDEEGKKASDEAAWQGVRYLTAEHVQKLAEECVRQVKLRGPFLNMADFVNRRLAGGETGRCGALQAAIDWDEFNGNSAGNSRDSINGRFKRSGDMVSSTPPADGFVNPEAHLGSKFTNIPGYVMQGDLLKRIGNQITVRDDTFTIRAYGESRDAKGQLKSQAYCEAVVQRGNHYVDDSDEATTRSENLNSETNRMFGRKLELVTFKWLSMNETKN